LKSHEKLVNRPSVWKTSQLLFGSSLIWSNLHMLSEPHAASEPHVDRIHSKNFF
jgi:hypothetical protein